MRITQRQHKPYTRSTQGLNGDPLPTHNVSHWLGYKYEQKSAQGHSEPACWSAHGVLSSCRSLLWDWIVSFSLSRYFSLRIIFLNKTTKMPKMTKPYTEDDREEGEKEPGETLASEETAVRANTSDGARSGLNNKLSWRGANGADGVSAGWRTRHIVVLT